MNEFDKDSDSINNNNDSAYSLSNTDESNIDKTQENLFGETINNGLYEDISNINHENNMNGEITPPLNINIDINDTVKNNIDNINDLSDIPYMKSISSENENDMQNPEDILSREIMVNPKTKEPTKYKKVLAAVVVASIFGGTSIGFGFGAASSLVDYFVKQKDVKMQSAEKITEENFSFDELSSKNTEENIDVFANKPMPDGSATSYASIINKVEPSVVCITSTLTVPDVQFGMDFSNTGSGSGILFFESDTKYYIATNAHVVQDASSLSVSIENSDPISAKLVGADRYNDLAVIYINKADVKSAGVENIVLATFGDSDNMEVGDIVLAIGNALGEGNIATNGIVSAKNKTIVLQKNIALTVLQTNAAINPGNSGGPLVNLKGEVIGINTAKISESNTEGMGYSIPSNIAKPIIQDFMDSINRPYIGVQIKSLSSDAAKQFNLLSAGALVEGIVEGSPADKAGIKVTDVITGFNSEPILTAEQLTEAVAKCKIGDEVELKLIRDGKDSITLKIVLEKRL